MISRIGRGVSSQTRLSTASGLAAKALNDAAEQLIEAGLEGVAPRKTPFKSLDQALDTLIVSAPTPFSPQDCAELFANAPAVVARYFPGYEAIYARLGWSMFSSIDRVYVADRAARRLGFRCRTGFKEKLADLADGLGP